MKIIAFFNLKKDKDIESFYQWVQKRQTVVFKKEIHKMKNFKVYQLLDSDNYFRPKQIVQIFDWMGTVNEWRETLKSFKNPQNRETYKIANEWLKFCDEVSTQIIYAGNI